MKENEFKTKSAYNISMYAIYVALAFILSYIESLFPISIGIPGVKPGFANIVTVYIIYTSGRPSSLFGVTLLRTVLLACTFGNISTLLYSVCGGLLSASVMHILYKTNLFSVFGVSIAGGVTHNAGQLTVAAFILDTKELIYYFPVLLITGMIAGFAVGYIANICIKRISRPSGRISNNNN
ncbi:MAG: Gx transporter family protein [Lachnospiraceae bacterium]|nr:Gx transporter family protein [Lachnospiraceae bacterium]